MKEGESLREGDLLFQVTKNSGMSSAIRAATGGNGAVNFTHTAIVVGKNPADSVLEATSEGGVRIIPLERFLENSEQIDGHPLVVAMRVKGECDITAAVKRARSHIGKEYDYAFDAKNDKFYCSELVWASYLKKDDTPIFSSQPMNFRDHTGQMPRYWVELYERLGQPIPEGQPGTNPNDLSKEEILEEVYRW